MPLWFIPLITLGIKAVAACACAGAGCYVCSKVVSAVKGGQKLKQLKYQDREAARQAALEANRNLNVKETEQNKKLEQVEDKEKKKAKEVEEIKNKLNRSDLSEEEKSSLKRKLVVAQQELDKIKNEKKSILDNLKDLTKQKKENDKIINSTGSPYDTDRGWIWEVLTLENILICLAIYAVWKIVRDESR